MFLLILPFFGLTSDYRIYLFSQIHDIVFHGKGGYDYNTVYNMPIWLRKFTFNKIKEWYDKETQEYQKSQNSNVHNIIDEKGNVNIPDFLKNNNKTSYNVGVSKK
jgi:hypothetical protein